MSEKMDRRIRKTRAQMRAGLAYLMKTKSIKEITVKDLVEAADINRSTFYLHYTDIYTMLETIENDLICQVQTAIQEYPLDPAPVSYTHLDVYKRQALHNGHASHIQIVSIDLELPVHDNIDETLCGTHDKWRNPKSKNVLHDLSFTPDHRPPDLQRRFFPKKEFYIPPGTHCL